MANKDLTIGEVETLRATMNTKIAEAIQEFEKETGIRTGYIDIVRIKEESNMISDCPCFDEDRGDIKTVNVNLNMEL